MFFSNSTNNLENEESMIYSLVEEIYQNEKKISNINQKQQYNQNNPFLREIIKTVLLLWKTSWKKKTDANGIASAKQKRKNEKFES